jgi:hypothetical protein
VETEHAMANKPKAYAVHVFMIPPTRASKEGVRLATKTAQKKLWS